MATVGATQVATIAGVDVDTIRRWADGAEPPEKAFEILSAYFDDLVAMKKKREFAALRGENPEIFGWTFWNRELGEWQEESGEKKKKKR